ncbi:MAG TPA: DUF2339 domain-containing protein, partial [Gemmatimonadaceae bacterium]|nr:DUF2339 domain-containing protein [Gemmatimonadaceae bacterium]
MSDERRIENLEAVVRALRAEVAELRAEVRRLDGPGMEERGRTERAPGASERPAAPPTTSGGPPPTAQSTATPAGAPHPADAPRIASSPPPSAHIPPLRPVRLDDLPDWWPRRGQIDFETLVGRYGTMAVAALLTLMGVGALLTWAAARGLLGPTVRLGFGVLAAIALAIVGMRLRARGSARYGNTLLALALAVVHVDAWGAGPYLELVPSGVALAAAAAASAALAALAVADGDELLFDVGVGGALVAPFVTSAGPGNALVLLTYGFVVILAALVALRPREWRIAPRLLLVGAAVYAATALEPAFVRHAPWYRADASALFALLCAWGAWTLGGTERRSGYPLRFALIAIPALLAAGTRAPALPDVALVAVVATLSCYFMLLRGAALSPGEGWLGGAVLPIGFLAAALLSLADAWSASGGAVAAAWF